MDEHEKTYEWGLCAGEWIAGTWHRGLGTEDAGPWLRISYYGGGVVTTNSRARNRRESFREV